MGDNIGESEDVAEFNSALALLKRVNELEYMIEECLIHWNLTEGFAYLESYENELCFVFKKEEQKEIDDLKNKILKLLSENPNLGMIKKDARNNNYVVGKKAMPLIRDNLITLNKRLRFLKYKYGMGMPKKGEGRLF